jgi:hypothetical protein
MRLVSIRLSALCMAGASAGTRRDHEQRADTVPASCAATRPVWYANGVMSGRGYGLRCEQITRSEWQQGVSVTASTRRGHCQPGVIPLGPRNYGPVWLRLRPPGQIKKGMQSNW